MEQELTAEEKLKLEVWKHLELEVARLNGRSTVNRVEVTDGMYAEDVEGVMGYFSKLTLDCTAEGTYDYVKLVALQRIQREYMLKHDHTAYLAKMRDKRKAKR